MTGKRVLGWGTVIVGGFIALIWLHAYFVVEGLDYANKDFMSLWTGGRAVLEGLDPYDPEVWPALRAAYGSEWMPDARAPFPLWTFLFTAPFALFSLEMGAALWLVVQELLLVLNLALIVRGLARYEPRPFEVGALALVAFTAIWTILVLINGQMTFLLLTFLTLHLYLLQRGSPFWAGFVLAGIILKPNPFILFAPFVAMWFLYWRRWRVVAGGAAGLLSLFAASWLLQPGWLLAWLNVRSKTEVVTITPTIWGLAADLAPAAWLPLGLFFAILLTAWLAWYLLARPGLAPPAVFSLALAASLLVTPYTWAYEHALLVLPWLWLFGRLRQRPLALWLFLAWLLPWLLFLVATVRIQDSLGFLTPLLTLLALVWLQEPPTASSSR